MKAAKTKINSEVERYKKTYPEEYKAVVKQIQSLPTETADNKWDEFENNPGFGRKLLEYPDTLHWMMFSSLSSEEWKWFDSREGQRWFAKAYPEFRTSHDI